MKDKLVVAKILARIDSILAYCKDCSYEEFEQNTMLHEACVFNIL